MPAEAKEYISVKSKGLRKIVDAKILKHHIKYFTTMRTRIIFKCDFLIFIFNFKLF